MKTRTKRRKGRTRPPTVGKNCRWLTYRGGEAECGLKIKINDSRDDVKYGGCRVYDDVSCSKCRGCGYEEAGGQDTMVARLTRKLEIRNELEAVRERVDRLERLLADEM